jgi:hypothetical protein
MEALMIKDNTSRLLSVLARQVNYRKKIGIFQIAIDELAGLAGIENSPVKMIIEKPASIRIVEYSNENVSILHQSQIDRLLRFLEMREILGEMA